MTATLVQSNRYFCQEREFAIGGHCKLVPVNLQGPTAYETGGTLLDPQAIGAGTKGKIMFGIPVMTVSGTYFVILRQVSLTVTRLQFFVASTGAEVANATDLDAEFFTMAIGFLP